MDDSAGKKKSVRVFGKLSRNMAKTHLAKQECICELREFSNDMIQLKPKVQRGKHRDSINDGYGIIGYRPNRNMKGVSKFVFRHGVNPETQKKMEERCVKDLNKLHLMTEPFRPFVRTEYSVMKQVIGRTCLNKVGGQATAFSIGKNYHSRCHIDSDMYYTMLTVCGPSSVEDDKVIYYFTFPEYQIKIPLRSGDLLFFNPSILHSCSNPSVEPSFIMPGYVNTRTVLRCDDLSQ